MSDPIKYVSQANLDEFAQEMNDKQKTFLATKSELNSAVDEVRYYVTPQMYGAKGDGVTDDTQSIQNCINDCLENEVYDIFFPKGTYLITSPLVIYFSYTNFWYGKGITLRGSHKGDTILKKTGTATHNDIDTVIYCECATANYTSGSACIVENFTIKNESESLETYCINGQKFSRSQFKNLTLIGKYGIKCTDGFSNIYDDIIADTDETALYTTGTSNIIGKFGCFDTHNPYVISGIYSTAELLFGDNCTGSFVQASPYGTTLINSLGTESPGLDCIIEAGRTGNVAQNAIITVDSVYCFNLQTADKPYFLIHNAELKVKAMNILYQVTQVNNYLCQYDTDYGCLDIGSIGHISNAISFDKTKFEYFANKTIRNTLRIDSKEVSAYVLQQEAIMLGGNTSSPGISESSYKNAVPSVVLGGYFNSVGQYGEYKFKDGTSLRYRMQPPKGSLIVNDLTRSSSGVAGFISLSDNETYGNMMTNKAPIPIMFCTAEANIPTDALKNGTLWFDTASNKLKVYYNSSWVSIN